MVNLLRLPVGWCVVPKFEAETLWHHHLRPVESDRVSIPAPLAGAGYPNSPSLTYYDHTTRLACKSRSAEFASHPILLSTVQLARGRDIFLVIVAVAGQGRT